MFQRGDLFVPESLNFNVSSSPQVIRICFRTRLVQSHLGRDLLKLLTDRFWVVAEGCCSLVEYRRRRLGRGLEVMGGLKRQTGGKVELRLTRGRFSLPDVIPNQGIPSDFSIRREQLTVICMVIPDIKPLQ